MKNPPGGMDTASSGGQGDSEAPPPRIDAVLVFGATGRLGRRIVQKVRSYSTHLADIC